MSGREYLAACGTDSEDGSRFAKEHFGDSSWYDIYRLSPDKPAIRIERIVNPARQAGSGEDGKEEEIKPGTIAQHLARHDVSIIMARSIGPNVVKMRRKFVVAVSRSEMIDDALRQLGGRLEEVQQLLDEGEERSHLVLPRTAPAR